MKKFYFFLIVLHMAGGAIAQTNQPCSTCLPQGITFTTQAQINNFQANYPGCTGILGDVTIFGSSISNLNGLSVLTSIGGFLAIYTYNSLTSLTGLDSLSSIGGYLAISDDVLTNLTGLNNLTTIGGDLTFSANYALTSLAGLDNLSSIGGSLKFYAYSALTNLVGLEDLTSIGGDLWIYNNDNLISLSGLESLTSIGLDLDIYGNYHLTSLTGLEGLMSIGGGLQIIENGSLLNIEGLDGLTSIGSYLDIYSNIALTSLKGLDNIDANTITYLSIHNNYSLSTCAVQSICDYLLEANGTAEIYENATGCNSREEVEAACVFLPEGDTEAPPVFLVYPNPSSTQITVDIPGLSGFQKHITLFICGIDGRQLKVRIITDQLSTVDISGLVPGIYHVKVVSDEAMMIGKFVKQ